MAAERHETIGGNVIPTNYSIRFVPDFKNFRFTASESIGVVIRKRTASITLNASELKITKAVLKRGRAEQACSVSYDPKAERVALGFGAAASGRGKLLIEYEGVHGDRLYGFYRSKYTTRGKDKYMLTTHLEPSKARTAFPCIDEPEFKATFDISVVIDAKMDAVSNMPIRLARKLGGGKKLVVFRTTPRMSTYLLYIGVGELECAKGMAGKTPIRVITTKGSKGYAKLPLAYAKRLLPDLERYFGVDYPLPKLDLIAVPDFAVGAMENWGAIAFREVALLGDERKTSISGRQRIAEITAHEMAHQWFGDLVTMKWWDDIWLNESFATFMEALCVDRVFPEWRIMLKYYDDAVGRALSADQMRNTHPVSMPVSTPAQINELFDEIGYEKGGSVLYMLQDYVGGGRFRDGLSRHLKRHAYGSATKVDLWRSVQEKAGGRPVVSVMEGWVNRPGYPIVCVRDAGGGKFGLEQKRFTISGDMSCRAWKIPIKYIAETGEGDILMAGRRSAIEGCGSWLKLNYGQTGFYRVMYDNQLLGAIGGLIRGGRLGWRDAWGVENDLFAFARSGRMPLSEYVDFVGRCCMDAEYPLNAGISSHLNWFLLAGQAHGLADGAKALSLAFHGGILNRVGWRQKPGESTIDTKLRAASISSLGLAGDAGVVGEANRLFEDFAERGIDIDTNIRLAVYYTVALNSGSPEKFNMFFDIYRRPGLPEDRIRALQALGMMGDPALLWRALDLAMSGKVRLQDAHSILSVASGNPALAGIVLGWTKRNWKALMRKYDPATLKLRLFAKALGILSDEESRAEVERFFGMSGNLRDDIRREVMQALERIDANMKFIEVNKRDAGGG